MLYGPASSLVFVALKVMAWMMTLNGRFGSGISATSGMTGRLGSALGVAAAYATSYAEATFAKAQGSKYLAKAYRPGRIISVY